MDSVENLDVLGGGGSVRCRMVRPTHGTAPKLLLVVGTDPPNLVTHYDDFVATARETFGASSVALCIFELPTFGFSRLADSSLDRLAASITDVVAQVHQSLGMGATPGAQTGLVLPCVAGLAANAVVPALPAGTLDFLVVAQCGDYDAEKAWADRVNSSGLLSVPLLSRAYNYLWRRSIAEGWYRTTFPRRGKYHECSGCMGQGLTADSSAEEGARKARDFFTATTWRGMDEGATFPLAGALQMFFYWPDAAQLHSIGGDAPANHGKLTVPTLAVWGALDGSHKHTADRASFGKYLADPTLLRVREFPNAAHFPELQQPAAFCAEIKAAFLTPSPNL